MGFQINGTTVLDSSGIQNNANSFRTLDGNSILGSGNITDSGPADALLYAKVGVYTWASILKRPTGSTQNDYDTNFTVAAGGTIPASQLGCPYESSNFHFRQGLNEPSHNTLYNPAGSGAGSNYAHAGATGYSGTYRNMLTVRQNKYQSLFVRIS